MENNKALDIMLHGKTIRFFRSLKGVSCRELAEISGVKQSLLHKFETGRRNITSSYRTISMHTGVTEIAKKVRGIASESHITIQYYGNRD